LISIKYQNKKFISILPPSFTRGLGVQVGEVIPYHRVRANLHPILPIPESLIPLLEMG
jgi:hypothetical protein